MQKSYMEMLRDERNRKVDYAMESYDRVVDAFGSKYPVLNAIFDNVLVNKPESFTAYPGHSLYKVPGCENYRGSVTLLLSGVVDNFKDEELVKFLGYLIDAFDGRGTIETEDNAESKSREFIFRTGFGPKYHDDDSYKLELKVSVIAYATGTSCKKVVVGTKEVDVYKLCCDDDQA